MIVSLSPLSSSRFTINSRQESLACLAQRPFVFRRGYLREALGLACLLTSLVNRWLTVPRGPALGFKW
jgi:hypothetical protein